MLSAMAVVARVRQWLAGVGTLVLGWTLVIVGIPMLPMPGPGTLVIVAGLALLSRHYAWARWLRDRLQVKAVEAAKYGVATWPRILLSCLGVVWLVALGVIWWVGATIPEFSVWFLSFGPELPAQGWATSLGIFASAILAAGLLVYSIRRWR